MPAPSSGAMADNSLLAATAEYEETKIKLLGDLHSVVLKIVPMVSSISQVLSKDFALAQKKAGADLEAERETKPEQKSKTLKEIEEQGKGFWTLITAFFIPAILGFVSTIVDMTTPFGLLKGAVLGLVMFFASRKLLSLLAGSIQLMFSKIASLFMAKIIAPLGAMIAKTAIGQKIGGMFEKTIPSVGDGADRSTKPRASTRTRAPSSPNRAGGFLKSITGSGLLKGAGAMLLAAGAIFVLGEALEKFSNLKWETLAVAGTAIVGLATAVGILGMFLPFIIKGSAALALMGIALIPLAAALALTTPFLWGLGEALKGLAAVVDSVAGGIVSIIDSVANGIVSVIGSVESVLDTLLSGVVTVLETVSMLNPVQVLAAAGAIAALSGALVLLGAGSLVSGLLNLFSGNPIEDLIKLGNVAPNIVELAEVMADFGNIVEFFNDALDNLDGDKALKNFELMRDGILMVGKALDEVSMIKLVAFSALTNMSSNKSVVPEIISPTADSMTAAADRASGKVKRIIMPGDWDYGDTPFVPEIISPTATTISNAADRATGNVVSESEEPLRTRGFQKQVRVGDISGTLQGDKVVGNITSNGKTITPADPEHAKLAEQLQAANSRLTARRERAEARRSGGRPIAPSTNSDRASAVDDLTRGVNSARTGSTAQPNMMSVNNVNSVNKSETNYKSTSMGSALQGDALRYVY
jgi:hypothetical protein